MAEMKYLRTDRQQLKDQIQILRQELYDLRDKIIEAKIDLQTEVKKLAQARRKNERRAGGEMINTKAEAILKAIRETEVGNEVIIHNNDMSVWCILRVVCKEHDEKTDGDGGENEVSSM